MKVKILFFLYFICQSSVIHAFWHNDFDCDDLIPEEGNYTYEAFAEFMEKIKIGAGGNKKSSIFFGNDIKFIYSYTELNANCEKIAANKGKTPQEKFSDFIEYLEKNNEEPVQTYVDKLTEYIENGGKFTFTLNENPGDQECGIKSGSGYLGNFVAGETYTTFYVSSTTTWVTKGPLQAKPQCGLYSSKDDKNLLRFNKNEKKMNMWVAHFRFDEVGYLYYGDGEDKIGKINNPFPLK